MPSSPHSRRWLKSLAFVLLVVLSAPLAAEESTTGAAAASDSWPQYRGSHRNGVAAASGLLQTWPEGGPKEVWRRDLGAGFSGVAVEGGRIFASFLDGEKEVVAALDPATGKEIWKSELGGKFENQFGNGPRATPTVADGSVYALGSLGDLAAYATENGALRWRVSLADVFGTEMPRFGFSPSPLADGDLLIIEAGGGDGAAFAGLDRATGEVRWKALDGKVGYSSPIAVEIDGLPQLVFVSSGGGIFGLRHDGSLAWRYDHEGGGIAMPIFVPPNRIFASAANDIGGTLVEIQKGEDGAPKAELVWTSKAMRNHFNSSLLVDGHLYGFDNGTLRCISAETGESKWGKRGLGKGSLIAADGLLFVLSDSGDLILARATPEEYEELGRVEDVLKGRTWTSPALADGRLYLRSLTELVSYDVQG